MNKLTNFDKFKLCYIEHNANRAWFTSADLKDQWGDDWNDAPYAHNAGTPYAPSIHYFSSGEMKLSKKDWNEDKTPKYQLLVLNFSKPQECSLYKDFEQEMEQFQIEFPESMHISVEELNAKKAAWASIKKWNNDSKRYQIVENIYAGESPSEFVEKIEKYGAMLLIPSKGIEAIPCKKPNLNFLD